MFQLTVIEIRFQEPEYVLTDICFAGRILCVLNQEENEAEEKVKMTEISFIKWGFFIVTLFVVRFFCIRNCASLYSNIYCHYYWCACIKNKLSLDQLLLLCSTNTTGRKRMDKIIMCCKDWEKNLLSRLISTKWIFSGFSPSQLLEV